MKTFAQYAQEKSINNLAATLVAEGYDVEEVVSYMNYVIESNEGQDGEIILNELLSGLMNVGKGLLGGAARGIGAAGNTIGNAAMTAGRGIGAAGNAIGNAAMTAGRGIGTAGNSIGNAAMTVGRGIAQGVGTAGQYIADKYKQGEQGAQLQSATKQLNDVAQTLQKLGVSNPQVQQFFSQLKAHLTQLSQQVSGDRKARFNNMNMQMPNN
jgi:hypothetical protein